jgi:hypothetical protein
MKTSEHFFVAPRWPNKVIPDEPLIICECHDCGLLIYWQRRLKYTIPVVCGECARKRALKHEA